MKYKKFTPSDCKEIGIDKFEFVAKAQFLSSLFILGIHEVYINKKMIFQTKSYDFILTNIGYVDCLKKRIKRDDKRGLSLITFKMIEKYMIGSGLVNEPSLFLLTSEPIFYPEKNTLRNLRISYYRNNE